MQLQHFFYYTNINQDKFSNENGDKINEIRPFGDTRYQGYSTFLGYHSENQYFSGISDKYPAEQVDFYEFRRRIFDLAGKPYKKTFREWLIGF